MVEFISTIGALIFGAIGAVVAIAGDTWHKKAKGLRKLTGIGWIAVISLTISLAASITKEIIATRRAADDALAQKAEHDQTIEKLGEIEVSFTDFVSKNLDTIAAKDKRISELETEIAKLKQPRQEPPRKIELNFSGERTMQIQLKSGDTLAYEVKPEQRIVMKTKKIGGFIKIKVPSVVSELPKNIQLNIAGKEYRVDRTKGQINVPKDTDQISLGFTKSDTKIPGAITLTVTRGQ